MNFLYLILPLLFLLCSCAKGSQGDLWTVKKEYHDHGVACAKIHSSKLPHRGFDVIWQQNGRDEWILLESPSLFFEELSSIDVFISSENEKEIFKSAIRKGGQIVQLPPQALSFLRELEKENCTILIQVGPLCEELSWNEGMSSILDTPFIKPPF